MQTPDPRRPSGASNSLELVPSADEFNATDVALENAYYLRRFDMVARLAYGQSAGLQRQMRFDKALSYTLIARDAWGEHKSTSSTRAPVSPADLLTELKILNLAAVQLYQQGHYTEAEDCVSGAGSLIPSEPQPDAVRLVVASLDWTKSLLERSRNEPAVALSHARNALSTYITLDAPAELRRLRLHAASVALDGAEAARTPNQNPLMRDYLSHAREYLQAAVPSVASIYSEAVDDVFRLVYTRYTRLVHYSEDRIGLAHLVLDRAERARDPIGMGRAYQALAEELASQLDRSEEALNYYRSAVTCFLKSSNPSLAAQPRRVLRRYEHFGTL